jgi:NADP-dependent 3-hydroxy acid dehydrogenase YdfG
VTGDRLSERAIIVTGAASGFGRLITERAVARGAHVVAADIDEHGLDTLADDLADGPGVVVAAPTDVTRLEDVRNTVARCVERFDRVDSIVNNAGVMPLAFFSDHEAAAAAWDRCIDINIKGVLHGMIAVYDQMMSQGRGHVVNLSSIYGNHPVVGAAVYGASKAAVNMMSEAFRVECQGTIKVTIVKPTGVPGTALGEGVINPAAVVGILGQNAGEYLPTMMSMRDGTIDEALVDPEDPRYAVLAPEHIADAVIHALDQPWGVSFGDITVRATGDRYIL